MTTESIIDKLNKILALTKSPVEGEATAAAEMLQKLLTKHNLEIADLERAGAVDVTPVTEERIQTFTKYRPDWNYQLAAVLGRHFYSYPMRAGDDIMFIGRPENIAALRVMYSWMLKQIARIANEERPNHPHIGGRRFWNPFCEGMVSRLYTRLEDRRAEMATVSPDAMALVVHHNTEIGDYMEGKWGVRYDGQETAKRRADREAKEELLRTDPDEYYRKYPWERPLTPEEQAARDAEDEKARERYARRSARQRPVSDEKLERWRQEREATRAGVVAGDRVNIEPFLKAGPSDDISKIA